MNKIEFINTNIKRCIGKYLLPTLNKDNKIKVNYHIETINYSLPYDGTDLYFILLPSDIIEIGKNIFIEFCNRCKCLTHFIYCCDEHVHQYKYICEVCKNKENDDCYYLINEYLDTYGLNYLINLTTNIKKTSNDYFYYLNLIYKSDRYSTGNLNKNTLFNNLNNFIKTKRQQNKLRFDNVMFEISELCDYDFELNKNYIQFCNLITDTILNNKWKNYL